MTPAGHGLRVGTLARRRAGSARDGRLRDSLAMPDDGGCTPTVTDARWSNPWPVPKYKLEAPIAFADIPGEWWGRIAPTTTWTAWPTRGDPLTVHVSGPVVFTAHCLSNVGLRTDFRTSEPIPPVTQQHHPKDGVATTGNVTVEAVEVLDDTAPEWSKALEILKAAIEKAETKAASTDILEKRVGSQATRAKIPLKLEVLCRSKSAGTAKVVYYFEAVREIAPAFPGSRIAPNAGQMPASPQSRMWAGRSFFSQGFFELAGNTLTQNSIVSTFTPADRSESSTAPLAPFGSTSEHWIMHGQVRHEHYTIRGRDKGFKKVLDVPGGAC
jgi:hypothetical protein